MNPSINEHTAIIKFKYIVDFHPHLKDQLADINLNENLHTEIMITRNAGSIEILTFLALFIAGFF